MVSIKKNIIGLDLFAGAGGMSLGASLAGVDVQLAIEIDKYSAQTYSGNHPKTKVLCEDIRNIKEIPIRKTSNKKVLFGGPPCQGFSTSNQRTRNFDNPNNWLFKEYFRIVNLWKPDWIVFENVKGIVETEKGLFFEYILEQFAKSGYTTSLWILDASKFGVPQKRNRLFIIGSLNGVETQKPDQNEVKSITVKQAIADLPELENGASYGPLSYRKVKPSIYAGRMRGGLIQTCGHVVTKNSADIIKRYKHVPQGGNWENIPKRLMKNYKDRTRCHTGIYHRLREDAPSVVIGNYRKNMLIHPTQNRGLSVREAARLQSFPDNYEFNGTIGCQQQQVGNAVPPILAKEVFERVNYYRL